MIRHLAAIAVLACATQTQAQVTVDQSSPFGVTLNSGLVYLSGNWPGGNVFGTIRIFCGVWDADNDVWLGRSSVAPAVNGNWSLDVPLRDTTPYAYEGRNVVVIVQVWNPSGLWEDKRINGTLTYVD